MYIYNMSNHMHLLGCHAFTARAFRQCSVFWRRVGL
jgi:hypothetical protein